MEDWTWTGVYGMPYSEEDEIVWLGSLVKDQPQLNSFSNAQVFAEHFTALQQRALDRPTVVGDTLIPKPAVWPGHTGKFTNFLRLPKATLPTGVLPAFKRQCTPLPADAQRSGEPGHRRQPPLSNAQSARRVA
jgi:hypothetical protein